MIGSALFLALQAAAPQQAAMVAAADVAPQQAVDDGAAEAAPAAQPERKRVCRTVIDTRTGIMGKRSKVCRFVDETERR